MQWMVIWMLGIGASVAALVLTAAMRLHYGHMAIAGFVSILMALVAVREARALAANGAQARAIGMSLRSMGLVWTWGAIGLLVTYAFRILTWREWMSFFIAFLIMAGLTLFLSATMSKDADRNQTDPTMMKVARGYSIFVLVAMVITMVGLVIDGKMWRFASEAGRRDGWQDWAANNFFFFGALALACIAANALALMGKARD
jgi:hypothetical protein